MAEEDAVGLHVLSRLGLGLPVNLVLADYSAAYLALDLLK